LSRTTLVAAVAAAVALGVATGAAVEPATAATFATGAGCSGATDWSRAGSRVGHVATIRGRVAGTRYAASSNGSPTFLNLGVDYPDSRRFTVVIWLENRPAFGRPESRYLHRTICVRGLVTRYAGVPEIEARTPSQITLLR
jgi:hypothetical protein